MSTPTPSIAQIISAVHCARPCGLIAQNPAFQKDIKAAYELFMRVSHEIFRSSEQLCNLQIIFPFDHDREKSLLFQSLQSLKTDMEKIHNLTRTLYLAFSTSMI